MPGYGRLSAFVVPLYLPLSLFFFIAGGLIYLFNVNRTVFAALIWLVVIGMMIYGQDTVKAIHKPDTLFYAPFTPLAFRLHLCILYAVFQVCSCAPPLRRFRDSTKQRYHDLSNLHREGFFKGREKGAEEIISKKSSEIDAHILEWTFQSCLGGEDDALEKFFKAVPGFFDSKVVANLEGQLQDEFRVKLGHALHGFLDRTFSSDSVSESLRSDRLVICLNAARAALGSNGVSRILDNILNGRWHEALQSVEVGHSLRHWGDEQFSPPIRRIVTHIISCVRERDGRWIALAKDEFGIPDHVLQVYVAHGDSASLAILIHITRQLFRSDFPSWGPDILRKLSYFDISNTLPGLQQDFCALWDEIVQESRGRGAGSTPILILREIHHFYLALRRGTDIPLMVYYSDLPTDDDNIPFGPLGNADLQVGLSSNPSFPVPNPRPSYAYTLPAAEPTSGGTPNSAPSHLATYPDVTATGAPPGNVTIDISGISDLANRIPLSTSGGGPVHHPVRETDMIPSESSIVFDPKPIPNSMQVISRDTIAVAPLHLSIDSTISRADSIHHILEPPSSSSPSATVLLPISAAVSDRHITQSIGTADAHADSRDQNPLIPMGGPSS